MAVKVRARFWVSEILLMGNTDNVSVTLKPVVRGKGHPQGGEDDNTDWSKYTPSGEMKLMVTAEGAQEWFKARLGKDVAITFDDVSVSE